MKNSGVSFIETHDGIVGTKQNSWVCVQECWAQPFAKRTVSERFDAFLDRTRRKRQSGPIAPEFLLPARCGARPDDYIAFEPFWIHASELGKYKYFDALQAERPSPKELVSRHFAILLTFQRSTVARIIPKQEHLYYGYTRCDQYFASLSRKRVIVTDDDKPHFVNEKFSDPPLEGDVIYIRRNQKTDHTEWFSNVSFELDAFLQFLSSDDDDTPPPFKDAPNLCRLLYDQDTQERLFLLYGRRQ